MAQQKAQTVFTFYSRTCDQWAPLKDQMGGNLAS